ncbi:MAG: hypothetical protein KDB18_12895, partial [Salinibacterium sp.]|nr:hypothetical protein [Salinibacterium sp.]
MTVILGGWSGVWAQAPTQIEVERLMTADAAAGDLFGYSLDLSSDGNTALIGAYADNHAGGFDAGAAYVFVRDSNGDWSLPAAAIKLVAAEAALNNWFGWAVALSGDGETAVVGAHRNIHAGGFEAGAAYVFERSLAGGWDQVAKLTASDALMGDRFGWSVDVSDDGRRVLVGAYNDDHSGINDAGSAYVFARDASDTWAAPVEEARLFAADAAATDWFGHDVALSGDGQTALVGSMLDNHSGTGDGGSAYVFTRSALGVWTSAASATKLIASDVASGDRFGVSVCLSFSGDKAMVGAYLADIATDSAAGAAYLFERDGAGTWGP